MQALNAVLYDLPTGDCRQEDAGRSAPTGPELTRGSSTGRV